MTSRTIAGMVVEDEGQGECALLLHGLGGTSNSWQPLVPSLGGMRIIRPDLPGSGRSRTPAGSIDIAFIVASLGALISELGVRSVQLIAHSFGTLLAQHLAMHKPEFVSSLILFGPIVEPAEPARERLRARAGLARREGMAVIADQVAAAGLAAGSVETSPAALAFVRESHMRQDAEGFAKLCEALAGANRADASLVRARTLVVTGDEDAISPPTIATALADELPQGRARILSQCGHWATVEKPAECRSLISAFLREG